MLAKLCFSELWLFFLFFGGAVGMNRTFVAPNALPGWASVIKEGFVHPPDLQPPPSITVDNAVWENLMPKPLKEDLKGWIKAGGWHNSLDCHCKPHGKPPKIQYLFKDGVMWFSGATPKKDKLAHDYQILNIVAHYLNEKYGVLPPVTLYMDYLSIAEKAPCQCDPHFPPLLVLASKKTDKGVIRRPTPFLNPDWAQETSQFPKQNNPWGNKSDVVCWRGNVNMWPGGKDRLEVLVLLEQWKKTKPELMKHFDVGTANSFRERIFEWFHTGQITEEQRDAFLTIPKIKAVEQKWFTRCKYSLHLPGHSQGGYSRALQSLLALDTTLLFFQSPYREFYYDWLKEGKQFLTVNLSTLESVTNTLLNDDHKAKHLAANGALFYERYLQWENILVYWEWLILSMIRYQAPENLHITQNMCSCVPSTPLRLCSFCDGVFKDIPKTTPEPEKMKEERKREAHLREQIEKERKKNKKGIDLIERRKKRNRKGDELAGKSEGLLGHLQTFLSIGA